MKNVNKRKRRKMKALQTFPQKSTLRSRLFYIENETQCKALKLLAKRLHRHARLQPKQQDRQGRRRCMGRGGSLPYLTG